MTGFAISINDYLALKKFDILAPREDFAKLRAFDLARDYFDKCLNFQYNDISQEEIVTVKINISAVEIERNNFIDAKEVLVEILPDAEILWKDKRSLLALLYRNLAIVFAKE